MNIAQLLLDEQMRVCETTYTKYMQIHIHIHTIFYAFDMTNSPAARVLSSYKLF